GGPQSWIGEFALPGGKTLYSDPTAWEYTIGSGANPGVNGPVPPLSLVQSDIANGVWLPVGASAPNGSAPWGTIPDIASQANFLWHDTLDENSSSDGHFVIFRAKDAPKFIADLDVNGNKSLADKVDGAANYLPGYEGTTPKVSSGTTFNTSAYTGQKMKIVVEGAGTNAGITEVEFRIIEVSSYSGYAENASDPKITGANKEKDYSFAELADNDTFTLTLATAAGGQIEADRAWVDFWCKDYGGFADILITIKAGNQVLDSIRLDVPRDIDSDRLADRWELEKITEWENQYNVRRQSNLPILQFYSNNLSADDELRDPDGARGQNDPAGTRALPEHKTTGDALTMLEEYRGFILDGGGHDGDGANPIASGHNRLSPAIKELLVEVDAMVFAQGNTPGIVNRPPGGFSSALNKASQGFSDKNTGAGIRMYWVNSETSLAHQTFLSTLELFNFRAAHRDPLLKANFVHLLFWDTVGFASEGVTYEDAQTTPLHQTTDKKTGNGSLILIDQIHAAAARTKLGYTFETSMFTVLAHGLTHLLINPQQVVDPITNRQVWNIVREHEIHPDGDGIAGSRIGLLSLMYEPATRQNRTAIWFSNLTRLEIDLVGNLGLDR
ncbi:MAG: hypothetical protein JNM56_13660, partial [Planctomycetia bacterium]|nr:hypothetical protein [Planctomycetia bacterium]